MLSPLQVDGQYSRERTILGWHPMNPARWVARVLWPLLHEKGMYEVEVTGWPVARLAECLCA